MHLHKLKRFEYCSWLAKLSSRISKEKNCPANKVSRINGEYVACMPLTKRDDIKLRKGIEPEPAILDEEVMWAMKQMPHTKAPGVDNIPVKLCE